MFSSEILFFCIAVMFYLRAVQLFLATFPIHCISFSSSGSQLQLLLLKMVISRTIRLYIVDIIISICF